MKNSRAFTLVELLVVISIISLLSSIVIASLNSARDKAKISAIQENLRNMVPQMELSYSDNGNYSGINAVVGSLNPTSTVCLGPIANMAQSIEDGGSFSRCFSVNNPSLQDVYLRWGASALKYTNTNSFQAWSVSPGGLVTWDTQGVDSSGSFISSDVTMNWNTAVNACLQSGGRLPTVEELKTLFDAQCEASGTTACTSSSGHNPPGFQSGFYWSGTPSPINATSSAYVVVSYSGFIKTYSMINNEYVRCVR